MSFSMRVRCVLRLTDCTLCGLGCASGVLGSSLAFSRASTTSCAFEPTCADSTRRNIHHNTSGRGHERKTPSPIRSCDTSPSTFQVLRESFRCLFARARHWYGKSWALVRFNGRVSCMQGTCTARSPMLQLWLRAKIRRVRARDPSRRDAPCGLSLYTLPFSSACRYSLVEAHCSSTHASHRIEIG